MRREEFNREVNFVLRQVQVSLTLMVLYRTRLGFIVICKFVHIFKCNILC